MKFIFRDGDDLGYSTKHFGRPKSERYRSAILVENFRPQPSTKLIFDELERDPVPSIGETRVGQKKGIIDLITDFRTDSLVAGCRKSAGVRGAARPGCPAVLPFVRGHGATLFRWCVATIFRLNNIAKNAAESRPKQEKRRENERKTRTKMNKIGLVESDRTWHMDYQTDNELAEVGNDLLRIDGATSKSSSGLSPAEKRITPPKNGKKQAVGGRTGSRQKAYLSRSRDRINRR